jgi:hypothetical protein
MRIVAIFVAVITMLFGFRLLVTALQSVVSGKILVREGIRTKWQPAPTRDELWNTAFRNGLMGVLLIILGIVLLV